MATAKFSGFTRETTRFLKGLSRNNNKAWFDAHRDDYEEHYLAPAKKFVEAMGARLVKLAPDVVAEPRVNGSIFRVNRDIRFSKDKTPYKDHIDLWFWEGRSRKQAISGFYLRVRADGVDIGAGAHHFEKPTLDAYRKRVADARSGEALAKLALKLERAGFPVRGEQYKKLPRGVEPISEVRDKLMRHGALFSDVDEKRPSELFSSAFLNFCLARWRKLAPLHRWLVDELQ